ncbi:MAG: DUF1501 domain-containing protein [Candidatus Kapaibacterium sp.]
MKRRPFLKRMAGAGILLPAMLGVPSLRAHARQIPGSPFNRLATESDRVFVIIRLFGGNDGLNTLVPFDNDLYYQARGSGTRFDVSIPKEQTLRIPDSDTLSFHPSLGAFRQLYGEGKLSIVQNVGYPGQSLSHFRSTDIWLSGSDAGEFTRSGWYARHLERKYSDYPAILPTDPFAIEMDSYLGTALAGTTCDMGIAFSDPSFVPGSPAGGTGPETNAGIEEDYVRETIRQSNTFLTAVTRAQSSQPRNLAAYPDTLLGSNLSAVARMIAGGLSTQLYIVNVDGFDTHEQQLPRQAGLLDYLSTAMLAFQRDLEAMEIDGRVCAMTISEMGRRVESNGTGTDHGAAAPLFVMGSAVNGGIIGHDPDLGNLDDNGNLIMEFDFRRVYASVLGGWFGEKDDDIAAGALPGRFGQLPIFRTGRFIAPDPDTNAGIHIGEIRPNPVTTIGVIPIRGGNGYDGVMTLHTIDGRQVRSRTIPSGASAVTIDVAGLPSGTYIYTIIFGPERASGRMIVQG